MTNALEEPKDFSGQFEQMAPALAHEVRSASEIKKRATISVVVGNPPYSGHSANSGIWIHDLLRTRLSDEADSYFRVDDQNLDERESSLSTCSVHWSAPSSFRAPCGSLCGLFAAAPGGSPEPALYQSPCPMTSPWTTVSQFRRRSGLMDSSAKKG